MMFKNGHSPASFSFIFGLFQQTSIHFLQQINVKNVHPVFLQQGNVKNVHPVYSAGIWTHNLQIASLTTSDIEPDKIAPFIQNWLWWQSIWSNMRHTNW